MQFQPTESIPAMTGDEGDDTEYRESESSLPAIREEAKQQRSSQNSSYGNESMPDMSEESKRQESNNLPATLPNKSHPKQLIQPERDSEEDEQTSREQTS